MKKLLTVFAFGILLAPSFAFAQVAPTPATTSDIDALKTQLIQVLMLELKMLEAQLADLQEKQGSVSADIQTIKTNTTPVATGGDPGVNPVSTPFKVKMVHYSTGGGVDYLNILSNKKINPDSLVITQSVRIDKSLNPDAGGCDGRTNSCIDFHTATPLSLNENVILDKQQDDGIYAMRISTDPSLDALGRIADKNGFENAYFKVDFSSVDGDKYTAYTPGAFDWDFGTTKPS